MNLLSRLRSRLCKLSMHGLARGPHVTRYFMYRRLGDVGNMLPSREGDVLSISHSKKLCEVLKLRPRSFVEANYPDHNFLFLRFSDESFDFVLSDQVLEHVEGDPQQAVDESWRVLRPGGIAVHATVFMYPIHDAPGDYWRFTPAALRFLSRKFSRIIECDGWGNFEAWLLVRDGMPFYGIPHAKWHPLHRVAMKNDTEWPIVISIVTQK